MSSLPRPVIAMECSSSHHPTAGKTFDEGEASADVGATAEPGRLARRMAATSSTTPAATAGAADSALDTSSDAHARQAAFSPDTVPPIVLEAHPSMAALQRPIPALPGVVQINNHSSGTCAAADTTDSGSQIRREELRHVTTIRPTIMHGASWSAWLRSLIRSLFTEGVDPQVLARFFAFVSASLTGPFPLFPVGPVSLSSSSSSPPGSTRQPQQISCQPQAPAESRLGRSVTGLTNYGQTCFLNSVLQALSSVPSFEVYLHRIVTMQQLRTRVVEADSRNSSSSTGVCHDVLDLLWSVNGGCCAQIYHGMSQFEANIWAHQQHQQPGHPRGRRADPRRLLQRVGAAHRQFASRAGGGFSAAATREQQDAQEFWQALLGMVVEDADVRLFGSATPGALSNEDDPTGEGRWDDLTIAGALRCRRRAEGLEQCIPDRESSQSPPQYSSSPPKAPTGFHEEKKLEDGSIGTEPESNSDSDDSEIHENGTLKVGSACEALLHAPHRRMEDVVSSMSPSPFSGWVGSILQCRACRHVRPIRNHLFVDLPVVPTGVSAYLHRRAQDPWHGHPSNPSKHRPTDPGPPCTLEQCLEDYTSVERVHDVECRSCTRAREMAILEDEVNMLEQGIKALEMKLKKNQRNQQHSGESGAANDLAKPLRDELQVIRTRLEALRLTSPDDEGAMERVLSPEQHLEDSHSVDSHDPKVQLQRNDAFKCLLLTRLPAVLCIHVQRRFYDPQTMRASKTAQHVIFPEILDVGPYCVYAGSSVTTGDNAATRSSRIPYRLMSVIEHAGGAFYGHYVSYRRDPASPSGNQWLYISDDTVRKVDWNVVRRCQAYMLFYEAFV
jgi:ubiquitin C-terminal hydrolase